MRSYRNLLLTMPLGGLWHGAGWTFIVWGAFHGCGLAQERRHAVRIEALAMVPEGSELQYNPDEPRRLCNEQHRALYPSKP